MTCKLSAPAGPAIFSGVVPLAAKRLFLILLLERRAASVAKLTNVLDVVERHVQFPRSRSSGVSRRLQESGILPSGAPGVAPELAQRYVCLLLATLMRAAQTARSRGSCSATAR